MDFWGDNYAHVILTAEADTLPDIAHDLYDKYGLKGVGMWEATSVMYDPSAHTPDADAMWDSLCQRQ